MGGGSNAWNGPLGTTGLHVIEPGGEATFVNPTAGGWTVTPTTADILRLINLDGANAASYKLFVAGNV